MTRSSKKLFTKWHKLAGVGVIAVGALILAGLILTVSSAVIEYTQTTPTQRKIMTILREEYAAQPAGTKYTEGRREYWCADFVSWVMKEAEVPLVNEEGYWRIDDVPPLIDYYKKSGRFFAADSGYQPKVGDVVMYQPPSTMGNHANIVVKNDNGTLTTVGGNENNRIRVQTFAIADDPYIVGYGVQE